jgi:small GTP-binding protein
MSGSSCTRKVVLCGREQVGKTALFKRFAQDFSTTPYVPTVGAQFQEFVVLSTDNVPVTIQMWDTAGQERFEAIVPAFFRGADFVLLVCDLTTPESVESLRRYWRRQIRAHGPAGVRLMLLGNKVDRAGDRVVSQGELHDLAQDFECVYTAETSALTHEGVRAVLDKMADLALEQPPPGAPCAQDRFAPAPAAAPAPRPCC